MRALKITAVILAVAVLAVSAVFYLTSRGAKDAPEISCTVKIIEGKVGITDEELLSYVSAHDKQDGDLSDRIKVIRKKYFIEDNGKTTLVTFSVCDSHNNVTSIQRQLVLSDYHSPRIQLTNDLIMPGGYRYDMTKYATAYDVIDGDLSQYLKLISNEITNTEGIYPVNIKVSNSMADTTEMTLNAIVTDEDYFSVKVILNEYITYQPLNAEIDYNSFIKTINNQTTVKYDTDDIVLDTSAVDVTRAGIYEVYYKIPADNADKLVTMTRLFVVISEE